MSAKKPASSLEVVLGLMVIFVIQLTMGFFAWVSWQIAAKTYTELPPIPLLTGLALWIVWSIMLSGPLIFVKFFTFGFEKEMNKKQQLPKDNDN